jgi:integrase
VTVQADEGSYVAPTAQTFSEWADEWTASLRRPGESTRYGYRATIRYATDAFGGKRLRELRRGDVTRLLAELGQKGLSPSTQAKHLRVLGACLGLAVSRGLIARNPVRLLEPSERPRVVRPEAAYFDDDELVLLAGQVPEGTFRSAFLLCLASGLREAEAVALQWGDVSFTDGVIRVRRTYTPHGGPTKAPKSGQRRDVHVTDDLLGPLAKWWRELGEPDDDTLVLPGPGGYLSPRSLLRQLQLAIDRAEIPTVHPKTDTRRNWHSLRHTYARKALQGGASLSWLQGQLGHSSPLVTAIYQHWADEGKRQQVRLLDGVFAL